MGIKKKKQKKKHMELSHPSKFARMVATGKQSSTSVESAIDRADDSVQSDDGGIVHYGLAEVLAKADPSIQHSMMSKVVSGDLSNTFLSQLLPMISSVDPALMTFFSRGDGAQMLTLISSLYTNNRLDLSILEIVVREPQAREALVRVRTNYNSGGMAAVNVQDLVQIFSSLNFGDYFEDTKPISAMFADIISNRTINFQMLQKHLTALKKARNDRGERQDLERKRNTFPGVESVPPDQTNVRGLAIAEPPDGKEHPAAFVGSQNPGVDRDPVSEDSPDLSDLSDLSDISSDAKD
jgi:hypothetical protein